MPDSIRVMVVDDDPDVCELLTEFLGRRGYETEAVQTAHEAVRRFETSPPAAVILDLVLAAVVIARLRKRAQRSRVAR